VGALGGNESTFCAISMMWHPRLDQDHQHKGLRELIVCVCRQP
jgi:hypothetical protein